jgi:hypothetical protein
VQPLWSLHDAPIDIDTRPVSLGICWMTSSIEWHCVQYYNAIDLDFNLLMVTRHTKKKKNCKEATHAQGQHR